MESVRACLVSLLFVVLASFVPTQKQEIDLNRILHGLLKEEEFPPKTHPRKVAIGFGSCVDVIAGGLELFERLEIAAPDEPFHNAIISSEEELAETFAFFFQRGSASE
jgi:ADP-dependent glucokinase